MEVSSTKILMVSKPSSTLALLASSHLTAHHQAISNHLLEVFNTKTPMEITKGPRRCSNTRRLQVIKEFQAMVPPLLLAISHNRSISTFKGCTTLNIQVACMVIIAALLYHQAPISTRARTHHSHLSMVRLLTNTEDNRGGDLTEILGLQGKK
jgi:hypothetical protein